MEISPTRCVENRQIPFIQSVPPHVLAGWSCNRRRIWRGDRRRGTLDSDTRVSCSPGGRVCRRIDTDRRDVKLPRPSLARPKGSVFHFKIVLEPAAVLQVLDLRHGQRDCGRAETQHSSEPGDDIIKVREVGARVSGGKESRARRQPEAILQQLLQEADPSRPVLVARGML